LRVLFVSRNDLTKNFLKKSEQAAEHCIIEHNPGS